MAKSKITKTTLRLCFVDETGTPYHQTDLQPHQAKELLKRDKMFYIDFPGRSYGNPLHELAASAVRRSSRGVVAKGISSQPYDSQRHVIITLTSDHV